MLQVYMDDSGSHPASHNAIIAGYWGKLPAWRKFERSWSSTLKDYNVEEFKANQFWPRLSGGRRNPPYNGWSEAKSEIFMNRLLTIIEQTRIFPFALGMIGDEWQQLAEHHRWAMTLGVVGEKHRKPMIVPLEMAVMRTLKYAKNSTVNYTFDDNPQDVHLKQAIVDCFSQIKENMRKDHDPSYDSVGDFGFSDSKKAAPLQAADLLAYEAHRYAKEAGEDKNYPVRDSYRRALTRIRSRQDFQLMDSERLAPLKELFAKLDERRSNDHNHVWPVGRH